ncbi:unnamed protein product [Diamesa hyperborea]
METFELLYDYEEALARLCRSASDVDELRSALELESDVPKAVTDKQLLLFLDSCGSVEEAVKVIKIYYDVKKNTPQLFKNRDPESPAVQQCLNNQFHLYLPVTPDGCSVIYHGLSNDKSANYNFDEAVKTFFMNLDSCLSEHGPRNGLIFLFDMKNVGLGHVTKLNGNSQKAFFRYMQEGLPAKLKSIHVLNASTIVKTVMAIIKPFVKAGILEKIHLHSSSMDFEVFYKNVIPKEFMPSDYGGDLESVEQLNKKNSELLVNLKSYFTAEQEQVFLDEEK